MRENENLEVDYYLIVILNDNFAVEITYKRDKIKWVTNTPRDYHIAKIAIIH